MNTAIRQHIITPHATWLDHWRLGRLYRYPRCCIARWIAGYLVGEFNQCKRGTVPGRYVKCGVFHR